MKVRFLLLLLLPVGLLGEDPTRYWPQWRGPLATGVAPHANPPVEWNEQQNVRWKLALPGEGHSTPVIWGDRIFLTAAAPFGDKVPPVPSTDPGAHDNRIVDRQYGFMVLAVSRRTGKVLWEKNVQEALPREGGYNTGSLASNSPVTDGKRVYAFFGSRGLHALDVEGNPIWQADLGEMTTRHHHGEGASPALHGNTLVVNWDHEGDSFVTAFDAATGRQLWKTPRDENTSWSTPLIHVHDGQPQVIIAATNKIRSYALDTGKLIWECGGLSRNVVATPVAADGMVFISNSYDWRILLGIRLDGAKGDITGSDQVVWSIRKSTSYVPSPLLIDGTLYFLAHLSGILTGVEAKSGKVTHGPFRLDGIHNVYGSPGAAAGRVYISDLDGTTLVFAHGAQPKPLAVNQLEDRFAASPVFVDRELYLRGHRFLYCIAETEE